MSALRSLRTLATSIAFSLLATGALAASSVVVGWDPNPAPENVTGYVLHWSSVSRNAPEFTGFENDRDVGNVTEATIDLPDGTARCYFSVTAYNGDGLVSDYSTELGTVVVTPAASAGGSVSPSTPTVVEVGASLELQFTADTGYELEDVEVDGVSVGSAATYTLGPVDAPLGVLARFTLAGQPGPTEYQVTLSAGVGGSVAPSGTVTVAEGDSLSFAVTPDDGYSVVDVLVNGASVGPVTSYTLSDVRAQTNVSATFQLLDTTDNDNDQLPDAWEAQYFPGEDADPSEDSDADGRTNYQEYQADTDPTVAELDPALTPSVASPISGGTVDSSSPELSVDNPVNDAGTSLAYQFQVSSQPDMSGVVASTAGIVEDGSGVTSWPLPLSLEDQVRYYWRARAVAADVASEWTPINTFYLDTNADPTTTELVTAEFVPASQDVSVDIVDPTSAVDGLGVDIPAAALPYDFILTVSTVTNPPAVVRAARLAGSTVEFGPHGRPFADEVTILLPYDDQTLAEAGVDSGGELDVLTYNTQSLRWEVVPNAVTDYVGQRVVARVSHFSMYSLGVASEETPVVTPAPSAGGGGGGGCFIGSLW